MRNDSDLEYETNQEDLGMKQLFYGIIVKAWFRINFGIMKYYNHNKIIIQYCLNYYQTCWLDQNEVANDRIVQRDRVKQQYEKEQNKALNGEYLQVAKYARENHINTKEKGMSILKDELLHLRKSGENPRNIS